MGNRYSALRASPSEAGYISVNCGEAGEAPNSARVICIPSCRAVQGGPAGQREAGRRSSRHAQLYRETDHLTSLPRGYFRKLRREIGQRGPDRYLECQCIVAEQHRDFMRGRCHVARRAPQRRLHLVSA